LRRAPAIALLALLVGAAGVARAAELPFEAEVSLELRGGSVLPLGSLEGRLTRLADDSLILPALDLATPAAAAFTPPPASCMTPVGVVHEGFRGGRLAPSGDGFGGAAPLSGRLVAEVFDGALGGLEVPMSVGALASPAARTFGASPAGTAPPSQVFVSLSQSRWTVGAVRLTGTKSGAVTTSWQAAGSRVSHEGGQSLSLVAPIHVHMGGLDGAGGGLRRSVPIVGRLTIALPEPSLLAGELAAFCILIALAIRRTRA